MTVEERNRFNQGLFTQEEKDKWRDKILTDLYNAKHVHNLVDVGCAKNGIDKTTNIHDDLVQNLFMELSQLPADELIKLHENDPQHFIRYFKTLNRRKNFGFDPTRPRYPKGLKDKILFGSNLRAGNFVHVQQSDEGNYDHVFQLLVNNTLVEERTVEEVLDTLKASLAPADYERLEFYLYDYKPGRGKQPKIITAERMMLRDKVKAILDNPDL